jgi:hypothetical protein
VTSLPGFRGSAIAIDWSGAKARSAQTAGIRVAVVRDGRSWDLSGGRTREEAVDFVLRDKAPVLVGLDFSFGFPAWFAHERECATIDDVWALAERDGETMLQPTPPFWRERCLVPPERRFRECEKRLHASGFPAKSIFQLVGNGQVGAGSVRGMPLLALLRAEGCAIWPFDAAGERTAFEIYPTAMRAERFPECDLGRFASAHERDACISALAMWRHRDTMATLEAATDATTLIEGDVWVSSSP